jgi:hypothetical protein
MNWKLKSPHLLLLRASFRLAVVLQFAELVFGGFPLGGHGGGMSARSGESWSTGGEGKNMTPTDLLCHIPKRPNLVDTIDSSLVFVVDGGSRTR